MGNFKLSQRAKMDVSNIWEYTFNKWSITQADNYFQGLQSQFKTISKDPDSGKNYEFLGKHYFGKKYKSHIIFYKKSGSSEVEIIRILHEMMDIPNRLIE